MGRKYAFICSGCHHAILGLFLLNSYLFSAPLSNRPYFFDAGGKNSIVFDHSVLISPDVNYTPARGYGWIHPPKAFYERQNLARSRNSFEIDGVTGQELIFKADVPSGQWWVTVYLESGMEDSATTILKLNDQPQQLDWQVFREPAEGRNSLQKSFRVFHGRANVINNEIRIGLEGQEDSVRVLGLKFYPNPLPVMKEQKQILSQIKKTGKFYYAVPLDSLEAGLTPLIEDLEKMLVKDQNDAFARYWYDQLLILRQAEHYIKLMGWEKGKKETGMGIFDRFYSAVMLLDGILNRPDPQSYPLYERALWQRGRVLYWLDLERHGKHERASAVRDLSTLFALYPENKLLAMYNGGKIEFNEQCGQMADPNAPEWSILQLEALCHLRHIIHWWVLERQADNGEFGGKLDDDVELLREFPALVLSGDSAAYYGWKRLADGVWNSDWVVNGYSKAAIDVEHAAELIADTAPEMVMYSDDPEYVDRLQWSARHFKNLWTGITPKGSRFFRSSWFSSTEIRTDPPCDRDVEMNARPVKAIRYLAWKTGDREVINLLHEWSLAWVKAAGRTDKGKPAGIIPPSIRFADESMNDTEPTWYKANMFWDYYDWAHNAGSMLLDQLLFTYTLTGDSTLLYPLSETLKLIRKYDSKDLNNSGTKTGSEAWAVKVLMKSDGFWNVVEQWRLYTNDKRFDDLLLRYGTPYLKYRLTGNTRFLKEGFNRNIRYNFPLLTSEVLHTDRVIASGGSGRLGTFLLTAMLTGNNQQSSPYNAVSWENTDPYFTALVAKSGKDRLSVHVYSHADSKQEIKMRVWQLVPGDYKLLLETPETKIEKSINIRERGQRIPVSLPPRSLFTITILKN